VTLTPEYDGSGVSGVVGGGVRYAFAGLVGINGGGGVDFVGMLGEGRTRGDWTRTYVGGNGGERDWWKLLPVLGSFAEHMWGMVLVQRSLYVPISSNSVSVDGLMLSSQSRY